MKVLAIGNSFSQDATRYLHKIAQADGLDMTVVNLYIGGCSLRTHAENTEGDAIAYAREENGQSEITTQVSVRQALLEQPWDVVTLQQASQFSVRYHTYQPYLGSLSAYVRKYAPQAELRMHQTWAYEQDSERLHDVMGYRDQRHMFLDLCAAYTQAAKDIGGARIIPCGEAFQQAIGQGLGPLHRDTFHASLGLGRYLLACTWYAALTGRDLAGNSFADFDEPIPAANITRARQCAQAAAALYR